MTSPSGNPINYAGDNAHVIAQGQYVIIKGGIKMTAAPDESPEAKYEAGVANLNSRNPEQARELIWGAMMSWQATRNQRVPSEVLFHWLVAMLSGRTIQRSPERRLPNCATSSSRI